MISVDEVRKYEELKKDKRTNVNENEQVVNKYSGQNATRK